MKDVVRLVYAVLALTLAVSQPVAHAQTVDAGRGQLTVTVADPTGATVADAAVVVTRGADRRSGVTNSDGIARFGNLPAGEWTVTITREGFTRWQRSVTVSANALEVSAALDIAGFAETVQVESDLGAPTQIPLNAMATGGSRLDIPLRELPASLFFVSQELIQERGARSVEEAAQLAVGVQATTGVGSIPGFNMRGWSGIDISLMRDGIRQNTTSQSARPVDAFVLERVEILKGPASLLYGEGAVGGAVNLVSKSPIARPGLDMLLAYGSYNQYRAGIGLNVPLRRNLFARVDASQSGSDGWVGDSPQKLQAVAASLRWLPTSNASIKASGTYGFDDTSAYYSTPFINNAFDERTLDRNYNMDDRLTKSTNRWAQLDADLLLGRGWRFHNQLFTATHKLDWRNFEGYTYNAALNTVDVTSYVLIYRDDTLIGDRADLRKTAAIGGRTLNVTIGGEVQSNNLDRRGNPLPADPRFTITRRLDPFDPAPHFDPGFLYTRRAQVVIDTRAVYGEGALDLTDRLKVVSGLRWERIGLDFTPFNAGIEGAPSLKTYHPTTGRIGAVFEMTPSANAYVSYSRAVQPTTQLVSLDGSLQQFSLVPGRQFEVGAKGGAFDGRLDGTVAWFAIEKRDILITELIDGIRTSQQVGRQTSRGLELAVVARPVPTLTIAADYAITDANYAEYVEIVNNVNTVRSGNTPPNVPRTIWNIAPTQRIGPVNVTATLRQVGERWGDSANTRRVSSYTTFDAAVSYRPRSGSRITLRGRNLTDKIYTQSTSNTAGRIEPPRAVDVTWTMTY